VLDVGDVRQQREHQAEREDGEDADLTVHPSFTTWVSSIATSMVKVGAGRRVWSEIRSSSAIITQFMTKLDPPYARKGVVRPVSGMRRVTPPTITKTCSASETERPVASSLPKSSRQMIAVRRPRSTSSA